MLHSTNDPGHSTLHFLFMTPYFFHEWSKARHSPFPVYDPLLFPRMIQGTAFSNSCLWPLTFSTNDPRHGTLHFLVMTPYFFHEWFKARHSLIPVYHIQGTALSISWLWLLSFSWNDPRHGTLHFLFMTPYFFHERSRARHSPFPVYDPLLFPLITFCLS